MKLVPLLAGVATAEFFYTSQQSRQHWLDLVGKNTVSACSNEKLPFDGSRRRFKRMVHEERDYETNPATMLLALPSQPNQEAEDEREFLQDERHNRHLASQGHQLLEGDATGYESDDEKEDVAVSLDHAHAAPNAAPAKSESNPSDKKPEKKKK